MNEKIKGIPAKLKSFWNGLGKAAKRFLVFVVIAAVVAVIVTALVRNTKEETISLYGDGLDQSEAVEIYGELKAKGYEAKLDGNEIIVPESKYDEMILAMAELGYPQTTQAYSAYLDNIDFTQTDDDKAEIKKEALQSRLQTTLKIIDNIRSATVNLSIPQDSGYAWEKEEGKPTASITLKLKDSESFTQENVAAVKNLVAFSVEGMTAEDVTIIDANTGNELSDEKKADEYDVDTRANYEHIIKKKLEADAEAILAPIYGNTNVVAVASVTVNFDKIQKEIKEYTDGVTQKDHVIIQNGDSESAAEGVTGEENNTDIPSYPNGTDDANKDADYYERETENAIGYILTQTEKAQGVLEDATISVVVVTEDELTNEQSENIRSLVKNATSIVDTDKISVGSKILEPEVKSPAKSSDSDSSIRKTLSKWIWVIAGAIGLLIAFMIFIIIMVTSKSKKKINQTIAESSATIADMEKKIEETEQQSLIERASEANLGKKRTEDDVRDFTKHNPDLAAAIIRSMIKEEE